MKTGIYIEYHDHLTMDAFRLWVYQNDKNVLKDNSELLEKISKRGWQQKDWERDLYLYQGIQITMIDSSSYYGTTGLSEAVSILKKEFPDLPVKCFKVGWYTFPHAWGEVGEFFTKYLSPDVEMIEGNGENIENFEA